MITIASAVDGHAACSAVQDLIDSSFYFAVVLKLGYSGWVNTFLPPCDRAVCTPTCTLTWCSIIDSAMALLA